MENINPYEYHDNKLGVQARFIFSGKNAHAKSLCLIGYKGFNDRVSKGYIKQMLKNDTKTGRGSKNYLLVTFASLPYDWQKLLIQVFGEPQKQVRQSLFEKSYVRDSRALDYFLTYTYGDGLTLTPDKVEEYTVNASVLNLLAEMGGYKRSKYKSIRKSTATVWSDIVYDCNRFKAVVLHTLPENADRLGRALSEYKKSGHISLIHGMYGRKNAKKIENPEQKAFIDELISHHNNLDNVQIARLYNMICEKLGWKTITPGAVDGYRKECGLMAYAGQHGENEFMNNKAMLVKRSAPKLPMQYWTLDGWDAELLYQAETKNKKGQNVITYHNRLTIVVVLDPCTKYPVGYAIGTHETPELIKAALKNAIQHTKELFGGYYKPLQLQSDNYGRGTLNDFYQSLTKHYTPARVKNAKAKVIEPYFKYINKNFCQFMENWSGFGITSNKDSQPNADYLNRIRKNIPDINACADQLHKIMYLERQAKLSKYQQTWLQVDESDKLPMAADQYILQFGETTGFTNRIEAMGLCPTILGEKYTYDCFDARFRNLAHVDWVVKYEPSDLSTVVAESKDGKYRFTLQQKYVQPMAIADRTDADMEQLKLTNDFNKNMISNIIEQRAGNRVLIDTVIEDNPQLNDTLAKLVLTDSRGQHKNQRNLPRAKTTMPVQEITEYADIIEDNPRDFY